MSVNTPAVAELNKLKNVQNNLESAQLQFIELCYKEDSTFHDFVSKLNDESSIECQSSHQQILLMQEAMQRLKEKIQNVSGDDEGAEKLKTELLEMKTQIETFKDSSKRRYEELKSEERNITENLRYYEQMFETWSKPIDFIKTEPTFLKRTSLINKRVDCPEVKVFDQFLQDNQGHTHGWKPEDHTIFLKFKQKYKQIDQIVENVHKIFPDKSTEDIRAHFEWHQAYCDLKTKQKEAIKTWKINKQLMHNKKQVIEEKEDEIASIKNGKNPKASVTSSQSVEETRSRLMAWKEEKRRRQEQESQVQEMSDQFHRQLEIMKMQKNTETKEKVERWRAIKAAEKRAIEAKRREEELKTRAFKAMLANHFIREFQMQDERFVCKKIQNCTNKANKNENKKVLNKVPSKEVNRDPERLLRPTKTWMYKMEKKHSEQHMMTNVTRCNLNLNSIQKLRAPDWRK